MRKISFIVGVSLLMLMFLACASRPQSVTPPQASSSPNEAHIEIKVTSPAFKEGQPIPGAYTCDGANVSPPLEWSGVPKNAKTLAIICYDPDAPAGTWVHWVLFNLPADKTGLVENTQATETLSGGGMQGTNDFKKIGYGGPCPPSGTHHYFFKLYVLDAELSLKPGATKAELEKATAGHIVTVGQLMGTYSR